VDEKNLDSWTERLGSETMPVFSRTIECVAGMANSESTSFSGLAWSILQDPSLTAQVLKLSNSIYYNTTGKRIQTVSRAVMRLGFDAVRTICLSACLVESALAGNHRERLALEIARAFHAAVQAKNLATRLNLAQPEEVYVGALLSRIGQIAFWCFAGDIGEKLKRALKDEDKDQPESQVEMEVLGFRLERLTLRLAQEWKLSSNLESMLQNSNSNDPVDKSIRLGYNLAQACEKGWDSPDTAKVVKKISEFLKVSEQEASKAVQEASKDAAEITEVFGASKSSRLIPVPAEALRERSKPAEEVEKKEYPKTDYQIQIASLRDLSSMVASRKGDVNSVLSVLLEGIYRGIGMDRVIFALISPDRRYVIGKYALGWTNETIQNFKVSVNGAENIFTNILRSRKPLYMCEDQPPEIFSLITEEISDLIGSGPFFIMPICVKQQSIGLIYTDRNLSGRDLDEESFESFCFFGQQANTGLTTLAG